MKPLLIALLGCLAAFAPSFAQNKQADKYTVTGEILNKTSGDGVPYATISFISNDSLPSKKMVACDPNGKFTVILDTLQEYTLTVTAVGFIELKIPVNITETKTDLGKISIEEGTEIKEIVVTAQKPLVRIEVDKLVYNMESDPESQTNNALEMLYKVPLVTVDAEENITVNGQSNFKVLLNGKSSSMMSSNLKEVLKSMPAKTIKDIEVITNPSSKYDAEGVGGIINIITTRKNLNGYNGSVGAGIDTRGGYNGSLYLAVKMGKLSFSGRYYGNHYVQPTSEYNSNGEFFNNTDYHYSFSDGRNKYSGLSSGFSGEASFEIDTLNLISMSLWGYQGSYDNSSFSESRYLNTGNEITRLYENSVTSTSRYGYLTGNLDYQRTFRKPDQSFTISYKLDDNPDKSKYISAVTGFVNYDSYTQQSENKASGREQTLQADYFDPLTEKHQIEGGLKFILRQNSSNSRNRRNEEEIVEANKLDYDQYILGLYAGYLYKLKKFSAKAGLRLERTWNDGISVTRGETTDFKNRLFNLVPYITLSYMPKEGRNLKLSYTQRLSRPGIWYLDPYVNDVDSMNISYGNPRLDAEISHSMELGYSLFTPKLNFSIAANTALVNNSIERITMAQPNGSRISTYENIGRDQRVGLNLNLNYRPSPKFSVYMYSGISYVNLEANTLYQINNNGFSYRTSFGSRWTAWKDGTVSMNTGVYSQNIMLQGKSSGFYYVSLGASQYLFKRKLMMSVYMSDPFWRVKKYTSEFSDVTFYSRSESEYLSRSLRFNLTWNFGKMDLQVKKASRGIQNDDLKGGGNSQGGGTGGQQ